MNSDTVVYVVSIEGGTNLRAFRDFSDAQAWCRRVAVDKKEYFIINGHNEKYVSVNEFGNDEHNFYIEVSTLYHSMIISVDCVALE